MWFFLHHKDGPSRYAECGKKHPGCFQRKHQKTILAGRATAARVSGSSPRCCGPHVRHTGGLACVMRFVHKQLLWVLSYLHHDHHQTFPTHRTQRILLYCVPVFTLGTHQSLPTRLPDVLEYLRYSAAAFYRIARHYPTSQYPGSRIHP